MIRVVLWNDADPTDRLIFPVTPEKITVARQQETVEYAVQDIGKVPMVTGVEPATITFSCFLPGGSRVHIVPGTANDAAESWIYAWRPPDAIAFQLLNWMIKQPGRVAPVLHLDITGQTYLNRIDLGETPTEDPPLGQFTVQLRSMNQSFQGAHGDYAYDLTFTEYRRIIVPLDGSDFSNPQTAPILDLSRAYAAVAATETLQINESLVQLAQRAYGNSAKWWDIWQENLEVIGEVPLTFRGPADLRMPAV